MRQIIEKLDQIGAETLIVTDRSNTDALDRVKRAITIPAELEEMFTPIPYIIPMQLFAACLAERKGLNPDQPRTISKVTRTL